MSRFAFRLERVLRVRDLQETAAKGEWAAAVHDVHLAEEAEEAARAELTAAQAGLADRLASGRVDPRGILAAQGVLDGLRRRVAAAGRRVRERQVRAETLRQTWTAARRELRSLERLRERAAVRHRAGDSRREDAERDERALVRSAAADSSRPGGPAEGSSEIPHSPRPGPRPAPPCPAP